MDDNIYKPCQLRWMISLILLVVMKNTFMELTGQKSAQRSKEGLSRLNINYDTDTEDGKSLTRGDWRDDVFW